MIRRLAASVLVSFLLTETTEAGAAFLLGLRRRAGFMLVFLVNLLTNPAVVITSTLLPMRTPMWVTYGLVLGAAEAAAWLAEALLYLRYRDLVREMLPLRAFPRMGPFVLSAVLNGVSFAAGAVLSAMLRF